MKDRNLILALAGTLVLMGAAVVRCETSLATAREVEANFRYLGNTKLAGVDGKEFESSRFLPITPLSLLVALESGPRKLKKETDLRCTLSPRVKMLGEHAVIETLLTCNDGKVLVVKGIQLETDYYVVRGVE